MSHTAKLIKARDNGARITAAFQPWISDLHAGEVVLMRRSANDPAPWVLLSAWEAGMDDPWRFPGSELTAVDPATGKPF